MKVILVGGGTSGHINPALNIAEYIKKVDPSSQILYVGSKIGMEVELSKKVGLDFKGITVSGFSRNVDLNFAKKNFNAIKNAIVSYFESRGILKEFNPDICIGTGGYVMGSFLCQALMSGIPFVLQEQNSIPGLTTKLLSKHAKAIFLGDENAKKYLKNKNCIVTGNPIKLNISSLSKQEAKQKLNITNDLPIILSFGGSLGSLTINNIILDIMKTKKYNHIHSYGKNNKSFEDKFDTKENQNVREYIYNMEECMSACDLIICRAGAMTLSEIATAGKPAILIPSPNVANNHQLYNAKSYAEKFTASVIEEKDLTTDKLINEIDRLLKMENNVSPKKNTSCEIIYKSLVDIIGIH